MIYYCCLNPGEDEHNAAYALLRYALKENGIEDYKIFKEDRGKPYIPGDPIFFSITHTKSFCAVVISERRVGIDAERSDRELAQSLTKRIFTEAELASGMPLIQIWTLKEAASKLSGRGVAQILDGMEFDTAALFEKKSGCCGRIYEVCGYTVAVCQKNSPNHDLLKVTDLHIDSYKQKEEG